MFTNKARAMCERERGGRGEREGGRREKERDRDGESQSEGGVKMSVDHQSGLSNEHSKLQTTKHFSSPCILESLPGDHKWAICYATGVSLHDRSKIYL